MSGAKQRRQVEELSDEDDDFGTREEEPLLEVTSPGNTGSVGPTSYTRLAFCVTGIILSFGLYGFLLEAFTLGGKEVSELTILAINSAICATFARVSILISGEQPRPIPAKYFVAIASTYLGGMFLSIRALRYVNYPTRILAKSAKAVPIMVMNFVFGKRYTPTQYASVLLIVSGTCIFMLYKPTSKGGGDTTAVGALLLVLSLVCDGTTGALEDRVLSDMGWKNGEGGLDLMLNINMYATILTSVALVVSGDGMQLFALSLGELGGFVTLGVSLGLGQLFLFYTIAHFGALVCSICTTSRKVLQIIFSFVWFGHAITAPQLGGLVVAVSGLVLNVRAKQSSTSAKKTPATTAGP